MHSLIVSTIQLTSCFGQTLSIMKLHSFSFSIRFRFKRLRCTSMSSCQFASTELQVCLNKNKCAIELNQNNFGKALCPGVIKKLAVEAVCGWNSNGFTKEGKKRLHILWFFVVLHINFIYGFYWSSCYRRV